MLEFVFFDPRPRQRFVEFLMAREVPVTELEDDETFGVGIPEDVDDGLMEAIEAYYDEEGIVNTGYWYPVDELPAQIWIPGWFDGNEWIQGYWVDEAEYRGADIDAWEPEEGWDAGWEDAPPQDVEVPTPLALPVDYPLE